MLHSEAMIRILLYHDDWMTNW